MANVERLWAAYHDADETVMARSQARERLILSYLPLVRYVAARMAATLPRQVDRDDLVSYGLFGLMDAIDRFEPTRGVRFEAYAITRIRGAMLDELRAMDWAPRLVRARAREVFRAQDGLAHRLGRRPTDPEIATELGWTTAEVRAARRDGRNGRVATLAVEEEDHDPLVEARPEVCLEDARAEDPLIAYEVELTGVLLARAVTRLPEREKIVTTLYFREGLTLAEIGGVLGVTESRVCQVYTSAALLLREELARSR